MLIAHKIALAPNDKQATYFKKACGVARFAYNWALVKWQRQYEAHKANSSLPKLTEAALRRQLNAIKHAQFPWMLEVTKCAPQMAIIQLGAAFKNFLAGRAQYPKFRKRGVHDRFTLTNDQFSVDGSRIRIPNLGWVRMREPLRFTGKIMSATISRVADRWFVSIAVDVPDCSHLPQAENQGVVGVDLGVSALATLSTGEKIAGPKPDKALLSRRQRLIWLARLLTWASSSSGGSWNTRRQCAAVWLWWRIASTQQQDVLGLRRRARCSAAIGAQMGVPGVRFGSRARRGCGKEPSGLRTGHPERPYGEFRRMSSMWRGRRWS